MHFCHCTYWECGTVLDSSFFEMRDDALFMVYIPGVQGPTHIRTPRIFIEWLDGWLHVTKELDGPLFPRNVPSLVGVRGISAANPYGLRSEDLLRPLIHFHPGLWHFMDTTLTWLKLFWRSLYNQWSKDKLNLVIKKKSVTFYFF